MSKELTEKKKWYDLMPWWAWIVTGIVVMAVMGHIPTQDSFVLGILVGGVSLFGLLSLVTGFVVGIVHLGRLIFSKPKH